MKTQKKKGLQKYQDSGYTKAPYNDPFASIFSNALGSGLYAYTNNNPFLNTHDSILGQPLSTAVGNQGTFLGSLPMFQQLNKPLGSWDQESENFQKQVSSEKTWEQFARENEANYKGDPQGLRAAYADYVNSESGKRYDSTVAAQKQWSEFGKPLAANMFALDELNTLSEKSYNQGLKLDAQDLTKGTKGQEFRGFFAKDGMRVGNFQSGGLTHRDSIEHQVDKIIKYEVLQGGPNGLALDGTNNMPDYRDPKYKKMLMDNIYTEVSKIMPNASAIEKAEAMDLVFNSGYNKQSGKIEKDPRGYALQEYYKKYDRSKLDKDGKWAGRKNTAYSFDEEYNNTIGRLPENERRVLMNLGRDWYYKNTNNPAPGVLSPDYNTTWYGRIHNTNDFKEFDPKNPKFRPSKKREGGPAEYPFLDFLSSSRDDDKIKRYIKKNEGSVLDKNGNHVAYKDSEGYSTVGYGHLMRGVESPILSQESADLYFDKDYEIHKKHAEKIPGFSRLDSDQKAALIDMTFNMGPDWYKKFPKFTDALKAGDLDRATSELRDSLWAKQVGPRAERNIKMIGGNRMSSITNREQGGSILALHRSMGADAGLPMQGKENGGQINQLQQILGYKDNSPFKNLPFQTINSNSITMDGVSQPLLAIADNGAVKLMPPNSGLHKFAGAKSVVEIPIVKNGGQITSPINLSKNINPFRLSPINSFGLGGFIRDGVPSRPKSEVGFSRQPISGATTKGPMGPKATDIPSYNGGVRKLMDLPENEYIPTENLIPIQAEKGEMIVLPTGDISKVMATKRHHQMDPDEVTDVAPEGAYILSSYGKVRINKDEAEQIITETGVKPYRVGGSQDSPTEKNLASMMIKKSMAPADVAKRVDKFFPVNSTNNPFELAANNENKIHRVPYLEGLIQLSELDKLRKGIDSGMESQQENEDEMTREFKNGGSTWGGVPMRNMLIPKFGDPGSTSGGIPNPYSEVVEGVTGLFQVGADLWNSYQQRKAQKEFVKKGTFLSDTAYGKARNEMGMGYLAGMLGVMNQDPTVTAKYNDPTYLRQMQTRTPMSTLEAISNRSYANMPNYMQNAPTWQAGLGAQQAAYAAALKAANDARLTIGEQDRNAQNDWLKLMQTNLELNNNNRVEAVNATRLNRNQQVGAVGNQTQGYMDSLANATLGQLSNQLSLEGVRANANVNFSNNIANSLKGGINTIGTAGLSYLDSRNRTTTNNPNAGYGSGVGPGYGGTGPSTPGYTCVGGSQYAINLDGSLVPTGKGC